MRAFPGNDERMSVLHQDWGGIGKSIPSALKISLDPRDFPREILGVGDGFSNPSFLLVEHGYNLMCEFFGIFSRQITRGCAPMSSAWVTQPERPKDEVKSPKGHPSTSRVLEGL